MPLPMVHLSVAFKVAENKPTPGYLLGSISPDAIHMREGIIREDKRKTHLYINNREANPREIINSLLRQYEGQREYDFIKGYCIHLITDRLWLESVFLSLMERFPKEMPKSEADRLYYLDTDQVDFNIYNSAPWRSDAWDLLRHSETCSFMSLLTAEEIAGWRDRVLNWFGGLMQEPEVIPAYVTDSAVHSFIDEAVEMIRGEYAIGGVCR